MPASTPPTVLGGPVSPSSGALTPLTGKELRLTGGFWAGKQQLNADVILDHCRTWMVRIGWVGNFDGAAAGTVAGHHAGVEFVDSEVYKLLEALAWELGRAPTAHVAEMYADLAAKVAAAQEPDGYLHTAFGRAGQPPRYSNLEWGHELYCFGHLFQAAVARLRSGHDDQLPAVARRLADHVLVEFGPDARDGICGHPEIEMGLVELGRATGRQDYIDQAALFVQRRGHRTLKTTLFQGSDYFLDDTPVRDATVLRGHAVRATYLAAGAVDVAVETGDRQLAAAVERQWAATAARRTYLTGGIGAHHQNESFGDDYELPADRAYAETCAAIGSVMLSWRLLLQTGETKYADLIERTLLNAVLVGPSSDGQAFFYANTLHQREPGTAPAADQLAEQAEASLRAPWFEVSCCPTNTARTLASIAGYFATKTADSVQLHQYGHYEIDTLLDNGTRVRLDVRSDYPTSGRIVVRVLEAGPLQLVLRIPTWAAATATLTTPRGSAKWTAGTVTTHSWYQEGDEIVLDLPMRVRVTTADARVDAVRGSVAFERGPVVLCAESVDLPAWLDLNDVRVDTASLVQAPAPSVLLRTRGNVDSPWPYGPATAPVPSEHNLVRAPLRPYADWGNRGPATMRVWIPKET